MVEGDRRSTRRGRALIQGVRDDRQRFGSASLDDSCPVGPAQLEPLPHPDGRRLGRGLDPGRASDHDRQLGDRGVLQPEDPWHDLDRDRADRVGLPGRRSGRSPVLRADVGTDRPQSRPSRSPSAYSTYNASFERNASYDGGLPLPAGGASGATRAADVAVMLNQHRVAPVRRRNSGLRPAPQQRHQAPPIRPRGRRRTPSSANVGHRSVFSVIASTVRPPHPGPVTNNGTRMSGSTPSASPAEADAGRGGSRCRS